MNGFKNWLQLQERIMVGNKEFRDPLPALKEIAKNHPNPDNLVVTFTAIDKVGINPKSDHDTPIGIYFYPIKYVIDKKMEVPFMGDQPYINVCEFTRPDKILRIKSGGTQGMDNPKLKSLPGFEDVQKTPKYLTGSNYSKLWTTTMLLSRWPKLNGRNDIFKWNKIFRYLDIDGFLDQGTGTIHSNEPTQAVVFTANAVRRLYVIDNTTDSKDDRRILLKPDNMSQEQIVKYIRSQPEFPKLDTSLLIKAKNKDRIIKIIIQEFPSLMKGPQVASMLGNTKNKLEIATLLGKDRINAMSPDDVAYAISQSPNKEEMLQILGVDRIKEFGKKEIQLTCTGDPEDKFKELIIRSKGDDFDEESVKKLMELAHDKIKIATMLGKKNIDKVNMDFEKLFYNIVNANEKQNNANQLLDKFIQLMGPHNLADRIYDIHDFSQSVGKQPKDFTLKAMLPVIRTMPKDIADQILNSQEYHAGFSNLSA